MMGMLLFVPQGINKSPYSDIVGDNLWDEAKELFSRDACVLHGISVDSPLSVRYYILTSTEFIINKNVIN